MTKQVIGLGTIANDHTGDSLRVAATKINTNFTEIYTAIGNGTIAALAPVAKTGDYTDLINKPAIAPVLASVPASATATGVVGQISFDASYFYVCVATNVWKRVAITTW